MEYKHTLVAVSTFRTTSTKHHATSRHAFKYAMRMGPTVTPTTHSTTPAYPHPPLKSYGDNNINCYKTKHPFAGAERWCGETTDQRMIPTRLCALMTAISRFCYTHCLPDQPSKLHGARTPPRLPCPAHRAGAHDNGTSSI